MTWAREHRSTPRKLARSKDQAQQARIICEHYGLNRMPTAEETQAEIANLKRRGRNNLDDSQRLLAAKLDIWKGSAA